MIIVSKSIIQSYIQSTLPVWQKNAMLLLENCESFKKLEEEMRKEILSKHKTPIKKLPNKRFYTRIDGRKIERKNLEDLEDVIIAHYIEREKTVAEQEKTVADLFDGYLSTRKIQVSDTTWQKEVLFFDTFIKDSQMANKPLSSLNLDDGYAFLKHCLKKKPNMKLRYWKNLYGCINQIFWYAIDRRLLTDNPFKNMRVKADIFAAPNNTPECDTVFTQKEQAMVCYLAEDDAKKQKSALPLGIVLLFNLGLRDGELCAIKWGDIGINLRGKDVIHIQREMVADIDENGKAHGTKVLPHCKSKAGDRYVELNGKALETLNTIKTLNADNGIPTGSDDFIFLRKEKNHILNCTSRCFDSRLRRYCKEAGMDVIKSPHDIRRTVITKLFNAGMSEKKLQAIAGHSSLKQTLDYVRLSDDDEDALPYLETLSDTDEYLSILNSAVPTKNTSDKGI